MKMVFNMMKKADVKKSVMYTIDLTKIDGDGAFTCPKCGTLISPDDETDENYQIVETKVKDDELAELVLMCNKCRSTIKLVGFLSQPIE
jgi:adenine-specific DNA methylase